ncbi:MAG: 50S ribosomal protein L22 [Chlamydiia bacterium]|nr:50S ribosomal protein L22 [Chlamydiia bacterium]
MTLAQAKTRYVRLSPQKARVVIALIRGKSINEAIFQLKQTASKPGRQILKTLLSAVANAVHNKGAEKDDLIISAAFVDKGPSHKRAWTRSRGMRAPIERKTSHITIGVDTQKTLAGKESK